MKKPKPPVKPKPQADPVTQVNRKQLMRLLYRYKGLLEWELSCLQALDSVTVPLTLPVPIEPGTGLEEAQSLPPSSPPGAMSGGVAGRKALALPKHQDPRTLESNCVERIVSIESYVDLVDVATPFVRALAEQ